MRMSQFFDRVSMCFFLSYRNKHIAATSIQIAKKV